MTNSLRSIVILVGSTADGSVVERQEISLESYYEGGIPLIDSKSHRSRQRIVSVTGEIYDSRRRLQEAFTNRYDDTGKYIGGQTAYSDGTVIED